METPTGPATTTCFHLTPPDPMQQTHSFLREDLAVVIKRKTSFEISPRLAKRAFVDAPPDADESVPGYQKRHQADMLDVHISNHHGERPSQLGRIRDIYRLCSIDLYHVCAASTLSDFIRKAIALKGKAVGEVDKAAATFGSSDLLRRAADTITVQDLQGWGLDGGMYTKVLRNSEWVGLHNPSRSPSSELTYCADYVPEQRYRS